MYGPIAELESAVELDGGNPWAQYNLGAALEQLNDLKGALRSFERAADLEPRQAFYAQERDRLRQVFLEAENARAPGVL